MPKRIKLLRVKRNEINCLKDNGELELVVKDTAN
jgi:hypothetical protein